MKLLLRVLLAVSMALLLVPASASAAKLDTPWTGVGNGTLTVVGGNATTDPKFDYNAPGATSGDWTFSVTAGTARAVPVAYVFTGFYGFYQVRLKFERFIQRGGVDVLRETLQDLGPTNCCDAPSGGFGYAGKSTFDVKAGDVYGYHMVGSHNTGSPSMSGSITIQEVDATPPSVTPVVTGTKAGGDFYSGTVNVKWTVKDDDSRIVSSTGCADATVTEDTAGKTITCAATSRGGTTTKSVTIARDTAAPALTTPAALVRQADGADGATVTFDASATDAIDPSPVVACTPASGARFAVGTTTVTCTATDAAGNSASKSFDIIVFAVIAPATINPSTAPTTPVLKTINASLAFRFTLVKQVTRLTALTVKKLPSGATVVVTCTGAGCPKKLKGKGQTLTSKGASVSLSSLVKGDLKPGTTIKVSISAPGARPATKTLKVRKGKAPVVGG